ncbi:MAG: hypothetical protein ABIR37_04980 [Candidatus Saccharimonadales bacterium]
MTDNDHEYSPAWEDDDPPELPPDERITLDQTEHTSDDVPVRPQPEETDVMLGAFLAGTGLFCVLLFVSIVLYVRLLQGFLPTWFILVFLTGSGLVAFTWARGVIKASRERIPTAMRLALPVNVDNIWVNTKSLRGLLSVLITDPNYPTGSDAAIMLVTRKSIWAWVRASWIPMLGAALLTAGWLFWVVPLLLGLIGLVIFTMWAGWHYVDWHSWYLVVTDKRLYVVEQPPAWLWWHQKEPFSVFLSKLQNCHPRSRGLGNLLGFGTLEAEVLGNTDDKKFNSIPFIPRIQHVSDMINLLQVG